MRKRIRSLKRLIKLVVHFAAGRRATSFFAAVLLGATIPSSMAAPAARRPQPAPKPIKTPAKSASQGKLPARVPPVKPASAGLEQSAEQAVKQLFSEGAELLRNNRAFEARAPLEKAAQLAPKSAGVHCNLGLAYQNSGNIGKAITEFQTALSLSPGMPEATLNLGGCFQSIGNNVEAIRWYNKYLTENPQAPQLQQVKDIIHALKNTQMRGGSDPHLPDYFASITAQGVYRWPPEKLPLKVFIESGTGIEGFRPSFEALLIDAFDQWARASGGRLRFTRVETDQEADIMCSWTNNPQEVTESGTQAERGSARIVVKNGIILRAAVKILTTPVMQEGTLSEDDMKKACLHEVGHVLGLQGHSTNNHDVMFFTVDTATVWPVLTKRDKATIVKLYSGYHPTLEEPAEVPPAQDPVFAN
ncbi:MAG TPA: tetratricopeptide repeat protein [Candidatus Obscuribacterales bacterium]